MKLWFKMQLTVTSVVLIYMIFIFNHGYVARLIIEVVISYIGLRIGSLFH